MFMRILPVVIAVLACLVPGASWAGAVEPQPSISTVVITGGHDFDGQAFEGLWSGSPGIAVTILPQRDDSEVFEDISDWRHEVIVLYNMTQNISEKRRANMVELLRRGVGLIAMHHSVAAFNDWPEYKEIIGASYFLKDTEVDGKRQGASKYRHNVKIQVAIADPAHPIATGLCAFETVDETYSAYLLDPAAHVVLSTDNPDSARTLCHVKRYEKANVCYIQLGHGPRIFSDPNFRRLVANAIRWASGRAAE